MNSRNVISLEVFENNRVNEIHAESELHSNREKETLNNTQNLQSNNDGGNPLDDIDQLQIERMHEFNIQNIIDL